MVGSGVKPRRFPSAIDSIPLIAPDHAVRRTTRRGRGLQPGAWRGTIGAWRRECGDDRPGGDGVFGSCAGVGDVYKRQREGNDLYHEMIDAGVIKMDDNHRIVEGSKVALMYGQMNEPPGARARVGLSGLTLAEYFRDDEGQDVLFFVDNIFRFTQAGAEVSALLGRIPSAVGYQPVSYTHLKRGW